MFSISTSPIKTTLTRVHLLTFVSQGACFRENCRYAHSSQDGSQPAAQVTSQPPLLLRHPPIALRRLPPPLAPDRVFLRFSSSKKMAGGVQNIQSVIFPSRVGTDLATASAHPMSQANQPICRDFQNGRCFRAR